MASLFRRSIKVTVSTIQITGLAMRFVVRKTLRPEPNTCELSIANLSASNRLALAQMKTAPVEIEAGYEGATSVIFRGDLRTAYSFRDGPDVITSLASGDGERAIRSARVNVSIGKDTPSDQVFRLLAQALGVDKGNLDQAVQTIRNSAIGEAFSLGTVLCGSAAREMTGLCRSAGLTWSVQDGKLQIIPLRQALKGQAIHLTPETGLIGSPSVDNKGILTAQMLMAPDVFPGRLLVLESESVSGQFVIQTTEHVGDTHGQDWVVNIEGKRY